MSSSSSNFSNSDQATKSALAILDSINHKGLTVPQTCSIRGSLKHENANKLYCYNEVHLAEVPQHKQAEVLADLVYHNKEGLWAISMERKYKVGNSLELSQSMMNSLVFLFELDALADPKEDFYTNVFEGNRLCGNLKKSSPQPLHFETFLKNAFRHFDKNETTYIREVRKHYDANHTGIKREAFKAVLAPYHLVDTIKKIFDDLIVIPVNAIEESLEDDVLELFVHGKFSAGMKIVGPNYLRGLQIFTENFPEIQMLGVHLTRLPLEPLLGFNDTLFDLKKYNNTYWKTSRLKNMNDTQLALLKSDASNIQVFREKTNQHLVIYRPHLNKKVATTLESHDDHLKAIKLIQKQYRAHLNQPAALFFKERIKKIISQKKELIALTNNNQFTQCAKVAENTALLYQDTKVKLNEYQTSSAPAFRRGLIKGS